MATLTPAVSPKEQEGSSSTSTSPITSAANSLFRHLSTCTTRLLGPAVLSGLTFTALERLEKRVFNTNKLQSTKFVAFTAAGTAVLIREIIKLKELNRARATLIVCLNRDLNFLASFFVNHPRTEQACAALGNKILAYRARLSVFETVYLTEEEFKLQVEQLNALEEISEQECETLLRAYSEEEKAPLQEENDRLKESSLYAENQRITRENQSLTAENQRITRENQSLTTENQRITRENQRITRENQSLTAEHHRLTTELQSAREEIDRLKAERAGQAQQMIVVKNDQMRREIGILQSQLQDAEEQKRKVLHDSQIVQQGLERNIQQEELIKKLAAENCELKERISALEKQRGVAVPEENWKAKYDELITDYERRFAQMRQDMRAEFLSMLKDQQAQSGSNPTSLLNQSNL